MVVKLVNTDIEVVLDIVFRLGVVPLFHIGRQLYLHHTHSWHYHSVTMICCFLLGCNKSLNNLNNQYGTQTASDMVQINKPILARLSNTGFESIYSQRRSHLGCLSLCTMLYCMHPVCCAYIVMGGFRDLTVQCSV